MPRQSAQVVTKVDDRNLVVTIYEIPVMEDLLISFTKEAALSRFKNRSLAVDSPVARDIKDFLLKSNVVGE
jgi:hypothetical protein